MEAILVGIIIGVSVAVAWTDGTGGGRINSSLYLRTRRPRRSRSRSVDADRRFGNAAAYEHMHAVAVLKGRCRRRQLAAHVRTWREPTRAHALAEMCAGILLCEYNLFTGGRKSGSRTDGGAAAAASEILPPYCHGILL